jgi:hypothetical protein
MRAVGIVWPDWALSALQGIEPHEVMQALYAQHRWPRPMVGLGGLEVVTIWARTNAARPLIVVLLPLGGLDWQIVGARDLRSQELAELIEWEAKRDDS